MATQLELDYWNTNKETGSTLKTSQRKALKQQDIVLSVFKNNPGIYCTPFDVKIIAELIGPITSVRRAMTNLEQAGKLIRTDRMKMGIYGKQNHTWRLA